MYRLILRPCVVLALALSCAARTHADETTYLPDGAQIVMSVKFQDFLKSKTFAEIKKMAERLEGPRATKLEDMMERDLGISLSSIERLTTGLSLPEEKGRFPMSVVALSLTKPAKVEDLKDAKKKGKKGSFEVVSKFEEIKVGVHTVHKETISFLGEKEPIMVEGTSFCLVDDKTLLLGQVDSLKAVLGREKKSELSKNVQAGLAFCAKSSGFVLVDVAAMPVRERTGMFRFFGLGEDNVQFVAAKASEPGKLELAAALVCKDEASAAGIHKQAGTALAELKTKLKNPDAPVPPDLRDAIESVIQLADAIKLSTKGNEVTLTASADPAAAVSFVLLWNVRSAKEKAPAKEPK